MARVDPFRGFRFVVEIDGIASAGFTRVKGLQRELKVESQREGGVNDYEHKLVTMVTHPVVVLERGLALDDLWKWALATADGEITRKTIYVRLGVRFDAYTGESFFNVKMEAVIEEAVAKGLALVTEGAVSIPLAAVGLSTPALLR